MGNEKRRAPRHSAALREEQTSRRRREPLNDQYYYEEPPRGWSGDFEDISSYSSDRKRREDQRTLRQQQRSTSQPPRKTKKKRGGAGRKAGLALLVVLVLVGAGCLYVFGFLLRGLTVTSISDDPSALGIQAGAFSDPQIQNIALFGVDAREEDDDTGRSDSLMILTVDKRHNKLKLTSILRDSEVQIEGYGSDKITHAYAYGGPELAIKTLNQNFYLDIQDYVTVNFFQMAKIVDAFGGVDLTITEDEMHEINNNLTALYLESEDFSLSDSDYLHEYGEVHLTGKQAVAYARIRHLDSDNVRASRQQQVLEALVQSLKQKNPLEYLIIAPQILPMCETSLSFGDILPMAPFLLSGFTMETLSIPGEEEGAYGDYNDAGAWVYRYDTAAATQHISRFIYEEESPY